MVDWNTQHLLAYFWCYFLFVRNNCAFKLIKILNSHLNVAIIALMIANCILFKHLSVNFKIWLPRNKFHCKTSWKCGGMRSVQRKLQCTYTPLVSFHYDSLDKLPTLSASQTGTCLRQEATFLLSRFLPLMTFTGMWETYFSGTVNQSAEVQEEWG